MLLLTGITETLRLITGSAADIDVYVAYVDLNGTTVTPGKQATPAITTATTTTICAAPAALTTRNIKYVCIANNHATASTTVDVEFFDGTNPTELRDVTLLPGENLAMNDAGQWFHRDAQNAEYSYTVPAGANLGPTGTLAESFPRTFATTNSTIGASGTLFLQSIYLTAGQLVSNITAIAATTAAATTTNLFFALYDGSRNLLAQSANQGAYTWTANTVKTLAMTTPYRVPVSGLYYVGVLQVATTIATLHGGAAKANAIVASTAPILHGASTTGLTTALPNPAAAITAGTASLYVAVS